MSRLDVVCIWNSLDVGRIVIAILQDLLVWLYELRFLLSELALEIFEDVLHRTVIYETCHTESKHVLALVDGLLVKTAVLETLVGESCDRSFLPL